MEDRITVAILRVSDPAPVLTVIDNTSEALSNIVGGYFEFVYAPLGMRIVCNDEGKLIGLRPNIFIYGDWIAGDILFVNLEGPDLVSLTEEQIMYLLLMRRNNDEP